MLLTGLAYLTSAGLDQVEGPLCIKLLKAISDQICICECICVGMLCRCEFVSCYYLSDLSQIILEFGVK